MSLKRGLFAFLFALACPVFADGKLAIFGVSEEKSLESLGVQAAFAASRSATAGSLRIKPWFVSLSSSAEENFALAQKVVGDPDVLGVVLHGEAAADPAIIDVFRHAGLATVSASSWAQPRQKEAFVTWLCPNHVELAEAAAIYAKREGKVSQVAVLDNRAPTAMAAAKAFATRFRSLGGKVVFEGKWDGDAGAATATTKALKANWPQMVFFAGEGQESAELVLAMEKEKELKAAQLLGQPTVFQPIFFDMARTKAQRTRGFFPCPDFLGQVRLAQFIGINFPRSSPEYHAYAHVAYKKPGTWAAMLFDATALSLRAMREAQAPGSTTAPKQVAAPLTPTAVAVALTASVSVDLSASAEAALSPTAEVTSEPVVAALKLPSRDEARLALLRLDAYRGIRGIVRFGATREPTEAKAMVYFALARVNSKFMQWREKNYGPPF